MIFTSFIDLGYHYVLKPILFKFDPEFVHDLFTKTGEILESQDWLIGNIFRYQNPKLSKTVLGLKFDNPIGLAAGFDYDGHLSQIMHSVGFGFNTVGTVTALPYDGNPPPRLGRLPKSNSLLVNKGFKSSGSVNIVKRLDQKKLSNCTVGISVGCSNLPQINTIDKAISDYLFTFNIFKNKSYVKYFELNISCPNTVIPTPFTAPQNFTKLVVAINKLKLKQPIFVKMPNEISYLNSDNLVQIAIDHKIIGFIFSNLVKDRQNPAFNKNEMAKFINQKGNFSGRPTFDSSNKLIYHTRKKFGKKITIIGTGGIFMAMMLKQS